MSTPIHIPTHIHMDKQPPQDSDCKMKKNLNIVVEDQELVELMRILMDDDAEAALAFLKKHFKGKARELLEGG